jgi:hypothetical protein
MLRRPPIAPTKSKAISHPTPRRPPISRHFLALGKVTWTYDLNLFKLAHKYDIPHLAQLAQTEIKQLCVHPPINKTDNFIAKVQGYAPLVEELYGEYAEMLRDNRADS